MSSNTTGLNRIIHGFGTFVMGATGAIVVCLILAAALSKTDDHGVTRVAGHPVMTVLSDSMTPTFRAGDLLIENSVDGKAHRLAERNVITFAVRGSSSERITHRIVRVEATPDGVAYRTQGDANNAMDLTPVSPDQIVGVYSWRIPFGGYVLRAVQSQYGMFLLIFIPALLLLLPLLAKWWRATGESNPEPAPPIFPVEGESAPAPADARKGDSDQFEMQN